MDIEDYKDGSWTGFIETQDGGTIDFGGISEDDFRIVEVSDTEQAEQVYEAMTDGTLPHGVEDILDEWKKHNKKVKADEDYKGAWGFYDAKYTDDMERMADNVAWYLLQDPEVKEAWDAQVKLFSEKKSEIIKKRTETISRKVSDNLTLAGCIDYVDFVQVTEQQANTISIDYLGEPMTLRRATEDEIADKSVDKIVLGYGYTLSGNEEAIRNFQKDVVQAMNKAFQDITTDVQDNEKIEIKPIYHVETRQEGKFRKIASINHRSKFKS